MSKDLHGAVKSPPTEEKLPLVYLLTIVKGPQKEGYWNVVLVEMRGDRVIRRKVLDPAEPSIDHCLDNLNRTAVRLWYFGESEEQFT